MVNSYKVKMVPKSNGQNVAAIPVVGESDSMSSSATNTNFSQPNHRGQNTYRTSDDILPDPLLQTGTFIDPNNHHSANGPTLNKPNREAANSTESGTPFRGRRKGLDAMETSSWLPSGWVVEDRVRTNGATAGLVDKYYIDPASGRRFRSKKDVMYYLETGTVKKKRKGMENSDADVNSSEGSRGQRNKSGTKVNSFEWNFDLSKVPERTEWVLTDANEDTWTPFIGGKKVPESDKRQWDAAFASITARSHGNTMY